MSKLMCEPNPARITGDLQLIKYILARLCCQSDIHFLLGNELRPGFFADIIYNYKKEWVLSQKRGKSVFRTV